MKTIIKNATLLSETGYGKGKWHVTVENKRIANITKELPDTKGAEIIDAKGNLLIPGFYNAHCHAAMTLFRGYGEDLPLQRWLEERIFPAEDRLNYQNVTVATRLAIAEMLDSIPIFARRSKFRHGIGIAIFCMALGKTLGSLLYFFKDLFQYGGI